MCVCVSLPLSSSMLFAMDAETFWAETEMRPEMHRSKTRPRRDVSNLVCLETVSRPRRRDRDYVPVDMHVLHPVVFDAVGWA